MSSYSRTFTRLALTVTAILGMPAGMPGQVKVLMSGGFSAAYQELLPEFQRATGISVTTARGPSQGSTPNVIGAQLRSGVTADVVIMNRDGLRELEEEGRFIAGTVVDLASVPLGVGVRQGAPKPEIGTVDTFARSLIEAKSISAISSSSIYLTTKLLPKLNLAGSVGPKLVNTGLRAVLSGESDFTILPVSELLNVQGLDYVGMIPADLQLVSVFTAGILTDSKQLAASRRLIEFLASADAAPAIRRTGMEPLQSRK